MFPPPPFKYTLSHASLASAHGACVDGNSWAAGLELPDAAIRELDALAARLKAKGLASSETERRSGSWLSAGGGGGFHRGGRKNLDQHVLQRWSFARRHQ